MEVLTFGESMVTFSTINNQSIIDTNEASVSVAGAESNVAIALARLNHQVKWVSRVGEDLFGDKIINTLQAEGIDTKGVIRDKKLQTGLMFKQKKSLLDTEVLYYRKNSAATGLSKEDINPEWIEKCKVIHITGITPSLSESCKELVIEVIRLGREQNKIISFDPNLRLKLWSIEEAKKTLLPIIKKVNLFFPGIEELNLLFGLKKIEDIKAFAIELKIPTMIVKDGSKGVWLIEKNHAEFVPSFKVNHIADEVGAGDAFASGFIHGYLLSKEGTECIRYGHALAALVISTVGDTTGLPTEKELYRFLEANGETIR